MAKASAALEEEESVSFSPMVAESKEEYYDRVLKNQHGSSSGVSKPFIRHACHVCHGDLTDIFSESQNVCHACHVVHMVHKGPKIKTFYMSRMSRMSRGSHDFF